MNSVVGNRLAARIAAGSVAVALLAAAVMGIGGLLVLRHQQAQALDATLREQSREQGRRISDRVAVIRERVGRAAASPLVANALADSVGRELYLQPFLDELAVIGGAPISILFTDFEGAAVAVSQGARFEPALLRWVAAQVPHDRPVARVGASADDPDLVLVMPVHYARTGRAEGALVARVAFSALSPDRSFGVRALDAAGSPAASGHAAPLELPLPGLEGAPRLVVDRVGPLREAGAGSGLGGGVAAFLVAFVASAALALVLGRFAARRVTRDLDLLVEHVDTLAGRPSLDGRQPRLVEHGSPEVQVITRAVNRLLGALEQSREGLRLERELRLAGIIESSTDGIITLDAQQRIVQFNAAASQMFRLPVDEALGGSVDRFVPPEHRARHAQMIEAFARSEAAAGRRMGRSRTFQAMRADGEAFHAEAMLTKATIDGRPYMTVVIRDVTDQLKAEEERSARTLSEAANREKTAFLARMSHELRTPLNAIHGFAELLLHDPKRRPDAEQAHRLEMIINSGRHLLALINDLIDVSRIELGALTFDAQDVDLLALTRSVLADLQGQAQKAGVALAFAAGGDAGWARVDPTRMRQVLYNLLTNAIKYNRAGGEVRVTMRTEGDRLTLAVADTGIGLDATQQGALFQAFNRLGRDASAEGTGIGLVICKHLVEGMGGTIDVRSEAGVGSVFSVTLRAAAASRAGPAAPEGRPLALQDGVRGRVLYIEDEPLNRELMRAYLQFRPGVRLATADDGATGLAQARATPPDLVLLDMMLPDMHGLELVKALREASPGRHLPIVGFSANAMPADIDAAMSAGLDGYLVKPISAPDLLAAVDAALAQTA